MYSRHADVMTVLSARTHRAACRFPPVPPAEKPRAPIPLRFLQPFPLRTVFPPHASPAVHPGPGGRLLSYLYKQPACMRIFPAHFLPFSAPDDCRIYVANALTAPVQTYSSPPFRSSRRTKENRLILPRPRGSTPGLSEFLPTIVWYSMETLPFPPACASSVLFQRAAFPLSR